MDDHPTGPLTDATALSARIGKPKPQIAKKEMPALDGHCRRFIALSPFLCLGTQSASGHADVSPRGDPPGFVKVLDDRTLLIPDRPGNRRVDSMKNILENGRVGLLFLVPGIEETLRVNGRATLVEDAALLAPLAIAGRAPKLAIRVDIDEVFFHCAKALKRSRLWDPGTRVDRCDFPRYGEIIRDERDPEGDADAIEAELQENYRTQLY